MKYIRIVALVLVVACLLAVLPAGAQNEVDGTYFATRLIYLRQTYRHGEYWNDYNGTNYLGSGPNPCPSCSQAGRYSCKGCSDRCGGFYYEGQRIAGQCLGFTYQLGHEIFGGNPLYWAKHKDASRLRPGDIIYGNIGPMFDRSLANHGVFVTEVTEDTVTFADCNWSGPCRIRWDKTVARSKVAASMKGANIYHAPNNMVGSVPTFLLESSKQLFAADEAVKVTWLAPAGGKVKLELFAKNEKGDYVTRKIYAPTASPFSLGKQAVGEYRLVLTHTAGTTVQTASLPFEVFERQTLPFTDVKSGQWFCKNNAVPYVYSQGLFAGLSDTRFGPDNVMKRNMFVTVLGRLSGATVDHTTQTAFADVPTGKWFSGYVAWAVENKIVSGVSATAFEPEVPITREQICRMLVSYAAFAKVTLPADRRVAFADETEISSWAKESVMRCAAAGIIVGMEHQGAMYFQPTATATRAQVATMICGFISNT